MLAKSKVVILFLQFCLLDGIAGQQLNVTLAVFSGRPDPEWFLLSGNPRFSVIHASLLAARNKKLTYALHQMPSRLGYKGFLIQELTQKQPELIVGPETLELQTLLFQTLPKGWLQNKWMKEFFNRVLKEEITPGKITAVNHEELRLKELQQRQQQQKQTPTRRKRYAYEYWPGFWNAVAFTQRKNNCYNYANNKITNTFAQPGRGSGYQYTVIDFDDIRNSAINDHLENLENDPAPAAPVPKAPNGKKHLVALAVDTLHDYHWLRLDQDGYWSHKMGKTPASASDNGNTVIHDPRTANLGNYIFACFMYSSRDDVTIA